jgi:hypothetical protein
MSVLKPEILKSLIQIINSESSASQCLWFCRISLVPLPDIHWYMEDQNKLCVEQIDRKQNNNKLH